MVILVLAILAFVFALMAKVAPRPTFDKTDFTWLAVLMLTILHLLSALVGTRMP
jgi:hypothetical protein